MSHYQLVGYGAAAIILGLGLLCVAIWQYLAWDDRKRAARHEARRAEVIAARRRLHDEFNAIVAGWYDPPELDGLPYRAERIDIPREGKGEQ